MSYNDVYLGEKSLKEELIRESKRLSYEIFRSMFLSKTENLKISNSKKL